MKKAVHGLIIYSGMLMNVSDVENVPKEKYRRLFKSFCQNNVVLKVVSRFILYRNCTASAIVAGTCMSKLGLDSEISLSHVSSFSNAPLSSSLVHRLVFHSPRYCWCSFLAGSLALSNSSNSIRTSFLSSSLLNAEFLNNGRILFTFESIESLI